MDIMYFSHFFRGPRLTRIATKSRFPADSMRLPQANQCVSVALSLFHCPPIRLAPTRRCNSARDSSSFCAGSALPTFLCACQSPPRDAMSLPQANALSLLSQFHCIDFCISLCATSAHLSRMDWLIDSFINSLIHLFIHLCSHSVH